MKDESDFRRAEDDCVRVVEGYIQFMVGRRVGCYSKQSNVLELPGDGIIEKTGPVTTRPLFGTLIAPPCPMAGNSFTRC